MRPERNRVSGIRTETRFQKSRSGEKFRTSQKCALDTAFSGIDRILLAIRKELCDNCGTSKSSNEKRCTFHLGAEEENFFDRLVKTLTEERVLALYNPRSRTELHIDASSKGIAGMLLQEDPDERLRPVYYVSKKTTAAEKQYHSSCLELMAVVWSVEPLRQFLLSVTFVVSTDSQAIMHMNVKRS